MRQLTGLDASFLSMETPTTFAQVAHLVIAEAPSVPNLFEHVKAVVDDRLHVFPAYRQRVVEVPFGLDHPYWVEDDGFDLEYHVREAALPRPGTDEQLGELVARIMSRPLDRTRPLWEMYVITGLSKGRIAWLNKIHHCAMDGVSGAELLVNLLDREREPLRVTEDRPWSPERPPSAVEVLALAGMGIARSPGKAIRVTGRLLRTAGVVGRSGKLPFGMGALPWAATSREDPDVLPVPGPPLVAPRTSWNKAISPHRRFAFGSVPLNDVKRVKRAFGCTVNDVVLAMSAGALRTYMQENDELPDGPLVSFVPVSVRDESATEKGGNRISGLWAALPVQVAEPGERLRLIASGMSDAKSVHQAIGADLLQDFAQFATPAISARAARLIFRTRMADRGRPIWNLVVSNVPGPSFPLYLAGGEMQHWYPVSIISDGSGLNITVHSYCDSLDFGVISCRELVPDPWRIVTGLEAALEELVAAAGLRGGAP